MRKIISFILVLGAIGAMAHAQVTASPGAVTGDAQKVINGYDGSGFYLRSADDDFSLRLSARTQFQHRYEQNSTAGFKTNTFLMRRANLILLGKIFKRFEFTLALLNGSRPSAAAGVASTMNWAADMTANIIPQFNVTMGSVGLPYDRLNEGSSGKWTFNEVPIIATVTDQVKDVTIARAPFGPDDDMGVRLWGDIGRFHYIVGVTNGGDANFFNSNTGFQYGGRVWYDIIGTPGSHQSDLAYSQTPALSVGLGGMFNPEDATTVTTAATLDRAMSGAADILFQFKGFSFLTELYGRKVRYKATSGGTTLDDFGYYAQASYFVIPKKFEVAVRAAQIFREGPANDSYEFGGGLNYYINGNNVKVQLDAFRSKVFGEVDSPAASATKATKVRTMLTFQI